ncbi:hypothetical protein [Deferribacter abyssi]|uniref:hypothetical protein n=1 Tax=Deferribacter abyssi TaxID=213806 RepID=UPI003C1AA4EA
MNKTLIIILLILLPFYLFALEIPSNIADYKLVVLKRGKDAKNDIYMLHGKHIKLEDAYVATYKLKNNIAYIWLSKSYTPIEAKEQIEIMAQKIQNSKVYSQPKLLKVKDVAIYETFGFNMVNYFYNIKSWNVWIAIKSDKPKIFLESFFKIFNGKF